MDNETFDKIVFKVTEAVLLRMPEVIGNLMQEMAMANKLNKQFMDRNPSFKNEPVIVTSVIEMVERDNPSLTHEEILNKAEGLIKQRIGCGKDFNVTDVSEKPNLVISNGVL